MKRLTKKEMVEDIFFTATDGQRTADNFVQGMAVIDAIAENNYRWLIQRSWDILHGKMYTDNRLSLRITARIQMHGLVDATTMNLRGRNLDHTGRSLAFRDYARTFGF